jgi:hypothetical protein
MKEHSAVDAPHQEKNLHSFSLSGKRFPKKAKSASNLSSFATDDV